MNPMRLLFALWLLALRTSAAAPVYVEDQFEVPPGFRIYRAANAELCGGSYDITFDGQGRLLVGDGKAVRRLADDDGDGVYDRFEVIAEGLGSRGPQGLLVYGDSLYAVGGDGLQRFSGYTNGGTLRHAGRLGRRFHTGGDHGAHTILRGHDGYLYLVSGDGGGVEGRMHITEETSPALFERNASVFRISPDGQHWECVASGGRNPPSLGMNYLGELFSWDSDMEWHVDLPWYRPLRLNHWLQGGDQGWQEVGAYPAYYIDALPPVVETGRGSPTWGTFYEDRQFPARYRDAFFVCDYLWKSASSGNYNTVGRLVVFTLKRAGAGWTAMMENFVRPRAGAKDGAGRPINFAAVDVDIAPDGSLFVSDHNQGLWRIVFAPAQESAVVPPIVPVKTEWPDDTTSLVNAALQMPQAGSEWSRQKIEEIGQRIGANFQDLLMDAATDPKRPLRDRLQAVRLLAAKFQDLPPRFPASLADDPAVELRGQAAWLLGLTAGREAGPVLLKLLDDADPFVRRRAAEALTRSQDSLPAPALLRRLHDPERPVRYAAMVALAHRPLDAWRKLAEDSSDAQTLLRSLVAVQLRGELPPPAMLDSVVGRVLEMTLATEDELDLLRVLGMFRASLQSNDKLKVRIAQRLLAGFPSPDRQLRWEQARLLGEYKFGGAFSKLLQQLESEKDGATQFHLAQALSRLGDGWTSEEATRLRQWFIQNQTGWFADTAPKGRQFPEFWATVLTDYAQRHGDTLLRSGSVIDLHSQLGHVVLDLTVAKASLPEVQGLYGANSDPDVRQRIIRGLKRSSKETALFLRQEYEQTTDENLQGTLLQALARMPPEKANQPLLLQGLSHRNTDTVVACAKALLPSPPPLAQATANGLISHLHRERRSVAPLNPLLVKLLPGRHPEWITATPGADLDRERVQAYWREWYASTFHEPWRPAVVAEDGFKTNEALLDFIGGSKAEGGDAAQGKRVYDRAQCFQCHGGGPGNVRLFGPELGGVTRRLKKSELAEALVEPSKQIAERFRAIELQTTDARSLTGFVTEENDEAITMATKDRIERIPKKIVLDRRPQTVSLMPEGLLNPLSWREIQDLCAYLETLGTAAKN